MSWSRYQLDTNGDIALTGGVAKTIFLYTAGGSAFHQIVELGVSFDGTALNQPVTVELVRWTFITGGSSTVQSMQQIGGPVRALDGGGFAEGRINYTTEPISLEVMKRWLIRPNGGSFVIEFPLYQAHGVEASAGQGIRCNAPNDVNVQGYLVLEEA